jgi:hypothetical protein
MYHGSVTQPLLEPSALLHPPSLVTISTFIFILSVVTAMLEVQIEGEYGWAKKLPTWRYGPPWLVHLFNGKELTGYHFWLFTMFLLFFHLPMLFLPWNWALEFTVLSGLALFTVFWDYLWFVFNPNFGLRKYNRLEVWWFRNWVGPFPRDYYMGLFFSALFAVMRGVASLNWTVAESLAEWAIGASVCIIGAGTLTLLHVFRRKPLIAPPHHHRHPPA